VSGEIVNLRRQRKAKARTAAADTAAQNRVRFGKSKAQRGLDAKIDMLEQRQFEAHRLSAAVNDSTTAENKSADDNSDADTSNGG
jgi:hypothetical protein